MAHKTMINGTAYAVAGGKTMAGGTVYGISKGRTMVGGTGYDIPFGKTQVITINGNPKSSYAYVTINGTKITSTGTYSYETDGTIEIDVYVSGVSNGKNACYVKLNGETVLSGYGHYINSFLEDSIEITFGVDLYNWSSEYYYALIKTS